MAARFLSVGEAAAARSALDAAGIDSYLADANIVAIDWGVAQAVGLIKVIVRDEDLEQAREVLECGSGATALLSADEEQSGGMAAALQNPSCPECGSETFVPIGKLRILAFVALLFIGIGLAVNQILLALTGIAGVLLALLAMPSHRCAACDHRWSPEIESPQGEAPLPDPKDTVEAVCPRCGSIEVHEIDYRRLKAIPLLFSPAILLIGPLWLTLPKRLCESCGMRLP